MNSKKRYKNLPDVPQRKVSFHSLRNFLKAMRKKENYLNLDAIDWVKNDALAEKIHAAQNQNNDFIVWLGHAGYLFRLSNTNFLIDPLLSNRASPVKWIGPKCFIPSTLTANTLPKIDVLLITHNHYDHLDKHFLKTVPNKKSILVILPKDLGKTLKSFGFSNIIELGWHESHQIKDITISATPAYHYSSRGLFDKNKSHWCGFAIHTNAINLYHSGDTGYGNVFKEIGIQYGPFDYAMLGIGAYFPTEMMKHVHTSPEEAFQIALDIRAKCILPMHWGTIALSPEPIDEPIKRLRAAVKSADSSIEIKLDKIGELLLCK